MNSSSGFHLINTSPFFLHLVTHRIFSESSSSSGAPQCNLPEGLLQLCHVVTNEPASDLKTNMMRAWKCFSQQRLNSSKKPANFKACLFGLCFFHSALIGWLSLPHPFLLYVYLTHPITYSLLQY